MAPHLRPPSASSSISGLGQLGEVIELPSGNVTPATVAEALARAAQQVGPPFSGWWSGWVYDLGASGCCKAALLVCVAVLRVRVAVLSACHMVHRDGWAIYSGAKGTECHTARDWAAFRLHNPRGCGRALRT